VALKRWRPFMRRISGYTLRSIGLHSDRSCLYPHTILISLVTIESHVKPFACIIQPHILYMIYSKAVMWETLQSLYSVLRF